MIHSFDDSDVLGRYVSQTEPRQQMQYLCQPSLAQYRASAEELRACYDHITELKASLTEMVGVYWGEGDGIEPAPACIQRAQTALSEEVR